MRNGAYKYLLNSREPILAAIQDKGRAGKAEEVVLRESNTEDQSQSEDPTRLHPWCKDKLEINILCKRGQHKRGQKFGETTEQRIDD